MDFIVKSDNYTLAVEHLQNDMKQQVAAAYRQCRLAKNLTQSELAEKSGVARPNISRFESGNYNPSLDMLVRLAVAMDMNLEVKLKAEK